MRKDNAAARLLSVDQKGLLPAVRTLHVHVTDRIEQYLEDPQPRHERDSLDSQLEVWKQLGHLVPQMPGLRHLHWAGAAIPDPVLEYLWKNPQIQLHLSLHAGADPDEKRPDERLTRLEHLPACEGVTQNLSSLRIRLKYRSAQVCRPITQVPLKLLLLSSPGLRALALDIAPNGEPTYCGVGLSKGETLPPLEELEVINYPWGQQPAVPGFGRNCLGYPEPTGTEMKYWAHNFDWSRLRRLCLHDSSMPLATHLAPHLRALDELEFRSYAAPTTPLSLVLTTIPSILTSLSVPRLPTVDIPALTAHAATLHTLSIHTSPLENPPGDLALLRDALPHLETLTLVGARDSDNTDTDTDTAPTTTTARHATTTPPDESSSPYHATLTTLSTFPRLRYLTLHLDIGPPEAPHRPSLTVASAADMFRRLRQRQHQHQHNSSAPPRLLQWLHLHSGLAPAQGEKDYTWWLFNHDWVEGNTTEFVVEAVSGSGSAWRRGTGVGGVQQEEGKDKEEEEVVVVLEEAVEVEVSEAE